MGLVSIIMTQSLLFSTYHLIYTNYVHIIIFLSYLCTS